jgi:hypothetical protein
MQCYVLDLQQLLRHAVRNAILMIGHAVSVQHTACGALTNYDCPHPKSG